MDSSNVPTLARAEPKSSLGAEREPSCFLKTLQTERVGEVTGNALALLVRILLWRKLPGFGRQATSGRERN